MPMAGLGKRFANFGYKEPKPLIKVLGKTIVEWSIETIGLDGNFVFCCRKDHIEKHAIDKILKKTVPNCSIVTINYQTKGTAQSVLEASNFIDNDDELVISDSDHYMIWDTSKFNKTIRNSDIDACVMVFPEEQNSNVLSYVKLNKEGYVIESAEKIPISKISAAGIHYYKKGADFVKYANRMIEKNVKFNNEFYVTPVYNEFVSDDKKIVAFPIIKKLALGSPAEVFKFIEYQSQHKD